MVGQSAIVLMSGGIDSAACAHHLKSRGLAVSGIFVDYGQLSSRFEEQAANRMAAYLALPLRKISVRGFGDQQTGEVVGRNGFLIFASLLARGATPGLLAVGLHAGTPYYDCSEGFFVAMERLVSEHTDSCVTLVAPFLRWHKSDVYGYFRSAELPIDLTYSCEAGTNPPCEKCASCRDRRNLAC